MLKARNNRGIVFITSLLLSLVSLILIASLMYLVEASSLTSGKIKRYTSAVEAAKAGVEEFVLSIKNSSWNYVDDNLAWVSGHNCKLGRLSSEWSSICNDICSVCDCTSFDAPSDIIADGCYDWRKSYGEFIVYAKIVDAKRSASKWIYAIELIAQSSQSNEISWFSILYEIQ